MITAFFVSDAAHGTLGAWKGMNNPQPTCGLIDCMNFFPPLLQVLSSYRPISNPSLLHLVIFLAPILLPICPFNFFSHIIPNVPMPFFSVCLSLPYIIIFASENSLACCLLRCLLVFRNRRCSFCWLGQRLG